VVDDQLRLAAAALLLPQASLDPVSVVTLAIDLDDFVARAVELAW